MTKYADLGSVSCDTEDLTSAFLTALEERDPDEGDSCFAAHSTEELGLRGKGG
jgi:hypothetical protein